MEIIVNFVRRDLKKNEIRRKYYAYILLQAQYNILQWSFVMNVKIIPTIYLVRCVQIAEDENVTIMEVTKIHAIFVVNKMCWDCRSFASCCHDYINGCIHTCVFAIFRYTLYSE